MDLSSKPLTMLTVLVLLSGLCAKVTALDFTACLNDLQSGAFGVVDGAVDFHGHKISNMSQAVGLTFPPCKTFCGSGHEPFFWTNFSDQFTTWLLPWLALISQLPYGAGDTLKNFESMILAVGSPMLSAYSLALSVNGNRWMVEQFRRSEYPNNFFAADILSNLQQVSFDLPDDHALASLITLRENDQWWLKLSHGLDYSGPQWTLSAAFSMVYVALAYIFIWINTIASNSDTQAYPNGQSLGSIWLSILPIVICSLQISHKTDIGRIKDAIHGANKKFFVAVDDSDLREHDGGATITIHRTPEDMVDEDIVCPTPIFFFARFSMWFRAAVKVTDAYHAASRSPQALQALQPSRSPYYAASKSLQTLQASQHSQTTYHGTSQPQALQTSQPSQTDAYRVPSQSPQASQPSRSSYYRYSLPSKEEVQTPRVNPLDACKLSAETQPDLHSYDFFNIYVKSVFLAVFLQWGTGGASLMAMYLTPSPGLGCIGGAQLIFLSASTVVWLFSALSGVLVQSSVGSKNGAGFIGGLAVTLRRTSKIIAALNVCWVLASSLLQMAKLENSCYCRGNVIDRGKKAWVLLQFPSNEFGTVKAYWLAGMAFASVTALLFLVAINVLIKRPKLKPNSDDHGVRLME